MQKLNFLDFLNKKEHYGSSNFPSGVSDEGEGLDLIVKKMVEPGAFVTYDSKGRDLPINSKNKFNFMKKCNCKKK